MSAGEWIAAIGLIFTILLSLGGFVFWMAALYIKVKEIAQAFKEFLHRHDHEHRDLWEKVDRHEDRLDGHDRDITKLKNCS